MTHAFASSKRSDSLFSDSESSGEEDEELFLAPLTTGFDWRAMSADVERRGQGQTARSSKMLKVS